MNRIISFKLAAHHFVTLVEQIKDNQWDNPTPDTEWSVRDLVNHVASENMWLPPLFAGKTISEVGNRFDGDLLGDEPKEVFKDAAQQAVTVISRPGELDKTVHLSFGDHSGHEYVDQMLLDTVIHAWDLAAALGLDRRIDPDLLQPTWEYVEPKAEEWRKAEAFGPAFELNKDQQKDLQNRLLAITGRNPNWQPA